MGLCEARVWGYVIGLFSVVYTVKLKDTEVLKTKFTKLKCHGSVPDLPLLLPDIRLV